VCVVIERKCHCTQDTHTLFFDTFDFVWKEYKREKNKKKQKDEKKKNIESMRERRREKAREGDSAG
jgi:hypothetical protein